MTTRRALLTSTALAPVLAASPAVAAQEATPNNAQGAIGREMDVAYGEADGQELLLDVFRPPARDEPRPPVILIHGGSWTEDSLPKPRRGTAWTASGCAGARRST